MKTLKKCLVLGLIIISLILCKNFQNPVGPQPPDDPSPNPHPIVTVEFIGSPITAASKGCQITLNSIRSETSLVDKYGRTWQATGQYLVADVKVKNVSLAPTSYLPIVAEMFRIIAEENAYSANSWIASLCFPGNYISIHGLCQEEEIRGIVVIEIPTKQVDNLIFQFYSGGYDPIEIRFKLLNLNH